MTAPDPSPLATLRDAFARAAAEVARGVTPFVDALNAAILRRMG